MDVLSINDISGSDLRALGMSFLISGGIMAAAAAIGGRATRLRRVGMGAVGALLLVFGALVVLDVITSMPTGRGKSQAVLLLGPWVGAVWSVVSLFKRPRQSRHRNAAVAEDVRRARLAAAQAQAQVARARAGAAPQASPSGAPSRPGGPSR